MVVGVNGVGKTTTIGKLAYQFKKAGKKVMLGASDTFRAAAVDQLQIWADRVGVIMVNKGMGADPAAVAFRTADFAFHAGLDVVAGQPRPGDQDEVVFHRHRGIAFDALNGHRFCQEFRPPAVLVAEQRHDGTRIAGGQPGLGRLL